MGKRILVIGATGLLGDPVARRLKGNGHPVRLMVRDIDRAAKRFGDGFEILKGSVDDAESLEKAMDGCFGVHINLSGDIEQPGAEIVSAMASRKGLRRISYISGTSVDRENAWFPLIRQKVLAEKAIRESGVGYCIFCPTWFMEVLPKYVHGNRAFVFGKQPNPYHLVAAADYARMVADSYGIAEAAGKRFIVHGPEGLLFHDAVEEYCKVFHPQITSVSSMPFWLAGLIATLKGRKEMKFASDFMAAFEKIGERGDPSEANQVLGAPTIHLEGWLRQQKTAQ